MYQEILKEILTNQPGWTPTTPRANHLPNLPSLENTTEGGRGGGGVETYQRDSEKSWEDLESTLLQDDVDQESIDNPVPTPYRLGLRSLRIRNDPVTRYIPNEYSKVNLGPNWYVKVTGLQGDPGQEGRTRWDTGERLQKESIEQGTLVQYDSVFGRQALHLDIPARRLFKERD